MYSMIWTSPKPQKVDRWDALQAQADVYAPVLAIASFTDDIESS